MAVQYNFYGRRFLRIDRNRKDGILLLTGSNLLRTSSLD